jgi:hypothetical protein
MLRFYFVLGKIILVFSSQAKASFTCSKKQSCPFWDSLFLWGGRWDCPDVSIGANPGGVTSSKKSFFVFGKGVSVFSLLIKASF